MDSRTYMTCGVKVDTTSGGWHKCLTKMLKKIAGASYSIDAEAGMAYISGKVNPKKLLSRLVKAGKEAELCWVRTGDQYTYGNGSNGNVGYYHEDQGYYDQYQYPAAPYSSYRGTGPDPYSYGYYDQPPMSTHYYPQPPPYSYYY